MCGESVSAKTTFCPNCGNKIEYEEPQVSGTHKTRFSRPPEKYDGPKKLYRARGDRMIAGVCGGLGQYFGIDSNLVRVLFILLTITGGAGILLYLIMVVIIPESPLDPDSVSLPLYLNKKIL